MPYRYASPDAQAYTYPLHIGQLLRGALDTRTRAAIVGSDGRRHDYATFGGRVHRLAGALAALGVEAGDTVAVMDWDSHRYLECYFAVPMMGAVLQTVNVRLSPEQIAYTLDSTQATVLLMHADFEPLVAAIAPRLPALARIVLLRDDGAVGCGFEVAGEYEALLASAADAFPFADVDEHALATTFHTTGTTGLPKAVTFSHRQLVLHALAAMATLGMQPHGQGLRRDDVYMPITPMFHVHAWGLPYVASLLGLKQVYPGRYEPARLLQLRRDEGVTFSHCVPTILQMILDAFGPHDRRDARWTIVIGGSALPLALHRRAAAHGITTVAGYGMSETGPVLSIARALDDETGEARERALCSAGHAVPLVQLRIVDEAQQTLPDGGGAQGEIVARAPWLTAAYPGDAAASERLWHGGWLHTQDVATRAADGRVTIRDRLKDVIKTGGEWLSSVELEDLTLRDARIAAAAYVGVPDTRWGERPVAFVVPAPGASVCRDSLRAHLQGYVDRGTLSRWALPDHVITVDALPRTSVGKIDKKALRQRYEETGAAS
jgi:fatty-acyl-CoA synthase